MTRATAIKAPPYSVASEKIVLGSIIRDPALLADVRSILSSPQVFFRPEYGRLYAVLTDHYAAGSGTPAPAPAAVIALLSSAGSARRVEHPSDEAQLRDLAAAALDRAGALIHARIVAEKYRLRCLIDTLTDILNEAYHSDAGFEAIIATARDRLDKLQQRVGNVRNQPVSSSVAPAAASSKKRTAAPVITEKKVRKKASAT